MVKVEVEILSKATFFEYGSLRITNLNHLNLGYENFVFRFDLEGKLLPDYFDTKKNVMEEIPTDCPLYVDTQKSLDEVLSDCEVTEKFKTDNQLADVTFAKSCLNLMSDIVNDLEVTQFSDSRYYDLYNTNYEGVLNVLNEYEKLLNKKKEILNKSVE